MNEHCPGLSCVGVAPKCMKIAIIGAGPAGSMAAALLAEAGHDVLLFERKGGAWEKPCGGGITSKGIARYPFLSEAVIGKKSIQRIQLIDYAGRSLDLPLRNPIFIYSRKALNDLMLNRAIARGAQLVEAHIRSIQITDDGQTSRVVLHSSTAHDVYQADFVIIANGAKSSLAESLAHNFGTPDYSSAMGYHLPIQENFIRFKFLRQFKGYLWTFPRSDHVSLGICSKLTEHTAEELKSLLQDFARQIYGHGIAPGTHFYSALIPTPELETLQRLKIIGSYWALIGDAAGFVDSITGEGIYYAIRSAELLVQCLREGRLEAYPERIKRDFGLNHERAAQLMPMFYTGRFWGDEFTARMIQFSRASRTIQTILTQLFEEQDYINLKPLLKRNLLRSAIEMALGIRP
jgi:geranylgeranyl reductase family protein